MVPTVAALPQPRRYQGTLLTGMPNPRPDHRSHLLTRGMRPSGSGGANGRRRKRRRERGPTPPPFFGNQKSVMAPPGNAAHFFTQGR